MPNEQPYNKRETDMIHESLKGEFNSLQQQMKSGFDGVHKRQDIANGRISKNEKYIYTSIGGLVVISMLLVPILGWALSTLANIYSKVKSGIQDQLSKYEVIIEE